MKKVDLTRRKEIGGTGWFLLTMQHRTDGKFTYFGKTKRECLELFKKTWGNREGFVSQQWVII